MDYEKVKLDSKLIKLMKKYLFILAILLLLLADSTNANNLSIKGGIQKDDLTILEGGIDKKKYNFADVEVLNIDYYYYPDAEIFYELLLREVQSQYPHLLGYNEIYGLYKKALVDSEYREKLETWRFEGGPKPFVFESGVEVRNNGGVALTNVSIIFKFDARVIDLKAKSSSLITNYEYIKQKAKWVRWFEVKKNIKVLPSGEYKMIYITDINFASFLDKLEGKWPAYLKVTASVYHPSDKLKDNNSKTKTIEVIPSLYVLQRTVQ